MTAYSGPRPTLKMNVYISPRVVSGPGILQTIVNGVLTTGFDITPLAVAASISDPTVYQIAIYNETLNLWQKTPLSNVPTTTTGDARTGHGDSAFIIANTDRYIALTATLTAPRAWTLPAANSVSGGTRITFRDEAGGITSTNTLTFGGTGADTINGAATFVLNGVSSGTEFRSDGISKWSVGLVGSSGIALNAVGNGRIRQSAGLSIIGRSANTVGDVADITAGTDGYVLRRSGTALSFGTVDTAGITDLAVTTAKIADANVTLAKLANMATASLIGRATAGTGVPEIITFAAAVLAGQQTGAPIKSASSAYTTSGTAFTTAIPLDNTIPQITEGTEVQTVTLTASNASNKIRLRWSGQVSGNTASASVIAAIFKDSGANAVGSNFTTISSASIGQMLYVEAEIAAVDTSAHTYRLRIGPSTGTAYLNGNSAGLLGGTAICTLVAEEIKG